jgi:hypothetical protein
LKAEGSKLRIEDSGFSIPRPPYEIPEPVYAQRNGLEDYVPRANNSRFPIPDPPFAALDYRFRPVSGDGVPPFSVDTSKLAVILKINKSNKVLGA